MPKYKGPALRRLTPKHWERDDAAPLDCRRLHLCDFRSRILGRSVLSRHYRGDVISDFGNHVSATLALAILVLDDPSGSPLETVVDGDGAETIAGERIRASRSLGGVSPPSCNHADEFLLIILERVVVVSGSDRGDGVRVVHVQYPSLLMLRLGLEKKRYA